MRVKEVNNRKTTTSAAHSSLCGGSTAGLRLACSASRIEEAKAPRETTYAADRGTALHEVTETGLKEGLSDDDIIKQFQGVVIKNKDMEHAITITRELIQSKVLPALAFTDETIPHGASMYSEAKVKMLRKPSAPRTFEDIDGAYGTADIVFTDALSNRHGVIDFKFGDGWIVRADDNDQGRFYLTCAIMSGLLPVVDSYEFWIFQPAEKLEPDNYASCGVYTLDELRRFNVDLHDALTTEPKHTPGAHCANCKGKLTCPAYRDFVRGVEKTDIDGIKTSELANLLNMVKSLRQFASDVEAAALRQARAGRVIPGYKLEPAQGNRAWRDEDKAGKALARKGLSAKERHELSLISPTQALKALRKMRLPDIEIERFEDLHIFRPDTGEKLVPLKHGEVDASAMTKLAEALAARGK